MVLLDLSNLLRSSTSRSGRGPRYHVISLSRVLMFPYHLTTREADLI
jgi:hypothetical protein